MSATVDERIVAAKFDASDFEKGVDKTVKKLDELKKSLDLSEATKSVKDLAEKTETSTKSLSSSLDKLTERFTTFTGMIKQRILGGLADEVAGVFFKMENSVKSFIKGISSDQVSAGMYKYEEMLKSVRVMMSAGESENSAYAHINQLREYSDQTSYSLSQMTDALSKMRAAGVDLDTATRSVEGIANACANAGINATDAQRAFFNLSQAYSSGILKYTDYRSLELLNMTTEEFKNQIMEAAVQAGTLKKVSEGVYQTINTNNKKVTAGKKVTAQNLQDMLRYNFVTSDVMNELFGGKFFFDEQKFKEYKKKYKDLDAAVAAAKKDYGETAVNAYLAAREARSFTDVVNTLKDVVSTGWSTTFENLFGKLEQAKKFFTNLAEGELADVVYKIGEYRNAILGYWNTLDAEGNGSGSKVFTDSILNITDALGTLFKTFMKVLPGFDELNFDDDTPQKRLEAIGENLYRMTLRFRETTERMKEAVAEFDRFMSSPIFEKGPTRIELIRQILSNLGATFGIISKVVGIAFSTISRVFYTLTPVFDSFLQILEKVTEPIVALKDDSKVFDDVGHSINNILDILDPIAKALGTILGFLSEVAGFFAQMAIDTVTMNITFFSDALGLLLELFTGKSSQLEAGEGVLNGIKDDFEGIKNACTDGLKAVRDFFGALLGDIRELLGLTDEAEATSEEGGIFARVTKFFETNEFIQNAKAWIDKAIIDVGNFIKSVPSRVKAFGANIYNTLYNLLFEETKDESGKLTGEVILTPLGEWVDGVIKNIKDFIIHIPDKIIAGVGKVANWIDSVFNVLFGTEHTELVASVGSDGKREINKETTQVISRFDQFIADLSQDIQEWFDDLPNKIQKALGNIGNFITRLFSVVDDFLFGKKQTEVIQTVGAGHKGKRSISVVTTRYKTGFSKWLDGFIKEIKKFILKIPDYVKAGIKGAGDIITAITNALFGKTDGKEATSADVQEKLEKPFLGINLSTIIAKIKEIGAELLNQIARIFTGSEDISENQEWFSEKIASGIEWIRTKASGALTWVLEFFKSIPTRIANLFKGEESGVATEKGPIASAIIRFGETVGGFIAGIPSAVLGFFTSAIEEFDSLWDNLYNSIIGQTEQLPEQAANAEAKEKSKWDEFVEKLGNLISTAFKELPVWVAEGIHAAVIKTQELIGKVTSWLQGENVAKEMEAAAKDVTKQAETSAKNIEKEAAQSADRMMRKRPDLASDEAEGENALLEAVKGIGQSIYNVITLTIPAFIKEAWTFITQKGGEVWNSITGLFNGFDTESFSATVTRLGENIKEAIKKLPDMLKSAFDTVSNIINGTFKSNREMKLDEFGDVILPNNKPAVDKMKKKGQEVGEQSGGSFIDALKDSFLNALSSLGPMILNGLSKALNWLGDVATFITNALTGKVSVADQIEAAYGKEQPELREALKNIGESIKNFFLQTIPSLLGSAFGELAANADEWFKTFFTSLEAAKNKEMKNLEGGNKEESKIDTAKNVVSDFMDTLNTMFTSLEWITTSNVLGTIGVIVALGIMFNALSDLFSLVGELEAAEGIVRWGAIAIALTAIAGMFQYISQLVESGNEEKIQRFEGILDKLGELMKSIAWIVGLFSLGKIAETVGDFAGGKGGDKLTGSGKIISGLMSGITGFIEAVGIGAGAKVGLDLAASGADDFLNSVSDSLVDITSGVDDIIKMAVPFIDDLGSLKEKLDDAIAVSKEIPELFIALYNGFTGIYEGAGISVSLDDHGLADVYKDGAWVGTSTNELSGGLTEFMKEVADEVELFMSLSAFLNNMANALSHLENVSNIGERLTELHDAFVSKNGEISFATILKDLFDAMHEALMHSTMDPTLFEDFKGMSIGLDILASAMSIFGNSIANLDVADMDAFSKMMDAFEKLAIALTDIEIEEGSFAKVFSGDNSLSKFGSELKKFGLSMSGFFKSVNEITGFTEEDVDMTNKKIDSIIHIAEAFAKVSTTMVGGSGFVGTIEELGGALPGFGESIAGLFASLNEGIPTDISTERSQILMNAVSSMAGMFDTLADLSNVLFYNPGFGISDIMEQVFGGVSDVANADKFAELVSIFSGGIDDMLASEGFTEAYKERGATIAQKLFEGIQQAFTEDTTLQPIITPVLNMDSVRQQLTDFFGTSDLSNVDFSSMAKAIAGSNNQTEQSLIDAETLYTSIGSVKESVDALATRQVSIGDVARAFTGIRIVTNTGALVGALTDDIDAAIGRKIWLITRSVSP